MSQNQFSKYFLYSIGEIILVVIGPAVQRDGCPFHQHWNESRKDVKREINILTDLKNDIKYNIENIHEGIIVVKEGITYSGQILDAWKHKTEYDTSMNEAFGFYSFFWDPDFRKASFENLKKEGVNLISNDSLRNIIVELFEIDMDILDVSDLNRHRDFMNSVGYQIFNKHLFFDRKTG